MKKTVLSITALIMVFISIFTLMGCSSNDGGIKEISYGEFVDAYYEAQEYVAGKFVQDENNVLDVVGDFTFSTEETSKSDSVTKLTFKETEDGEFKTANVKNSSSKSTAKVSVAVKRVDGVVFVTATFKESVLSVYTDVSTNNLLESLYTNNETVTTWHMGKNAEGYYISKNIEKTMDNNGVVTPEDLPGEYMYYESESEYKAGVGVFLEGLYNKASELFFTETASGLSEIKKNGNKYSLKTVNDSVTMDYGFDALAYTVCNYEVENTENLLYTGTYEYIDAQSQISTYDEKAFKNGAEAIIIDSFDGYDYAVLNAENIL